MIEQNTKIVTVPTMNRLFPGLVLTCPQMTISNNSIIVGQTGNVVEPAIGVANATGKFAVNFSHTNNLAANNAVIFNNGMIQK
jgi:hypothetical protein